MGYILPGPLLDGRPDVCRVKGFVGKTGVRSCPESDRALWNAGIVVARAAQIVEALRRRDQKSCQLCRKRSLPEKTR